MTDDPFSVPGDLVDAAPAQRICGWCRKEIAPGTQPATYGICHRCFLQMELDATRHGRRAGVMDDEARRLLDEAKRRNADIQALTANDMEADALVAVALTKVGAEAVDSLAKEAIATAGRAEEGKAIFKLRLQALFPEQGGA